MAHCFFLGNKWSKLQMNLLTLQTIGPRSPTHTTGILKQNLLVFLKAGKTERAVELLAGVF